MGLRSYVPGKERHIAPGPSIESDEVLIAKFQSREALSGAELDRIVVIQSRVDLQTRHVERSDKRAQRLDELFTELQLDAMRPLATIRPFQGFSPIVSAWKRVLNASIYCCTPSTGLTAARLAKSSKDKVETKDNRSVEVEMMIMPEYMLAALEKGPIQVRVN